MDVSSCNNSCPALRFGFNCSSVCDCGEGVACDSVTGACPNSTSIHPLSYLSVLCINVYISVSCTFPYMFVFVCVFE